MPEFTAREDVRARGGPVFNAPAVVLLSIAALAGIHALLAVAGEDWEIWAMYAFAFIPARFAGNSFPSIPGSQVWSFLTYAFLHGGWTHLLFNCLWLLIFGTPVARFLGPLRFLVLCAVAAIAGAFASLLLHWGAVVIVVGASGAISGLLGAAIPIMYGKRVPGMGVHPLSPGELLRNGKALGFMAIWLAITLLSGASGWTGNSFMDEGGIAWEAHIGGFLGGLATFYLLWGAGVRRT
ncbi:MAG: rhomboid family intramembrane serine protease [Alphaproteobacteria bacterium]|nr:rhomboid family intramembrane serine protease [Alphaproteobacteria bacterium]